MKGRSLFVVVGVIICLVAGCRTVPLRSHNHSGDIGANIAHIENGVVKAKDGLINIIVIGYSTSACEDEMVCKKEATMRAKESLQMELLCLAANLPTNANVQRVQIVGEFVDWYLIEHLLIEQYDRQDKVVIFTLWVTEDGLKRYLKENVKIRSVTYH